ncbi:MAG: hypothetical protein K6D59_09090 [Bacteroidales bacterium]|nr:hypothetical protein [Bacteroidales bacterium]
MKLIKCSHCGRPYYNSEEKCIYCGTPTSQSENNFVKQAITSPKSHKLMEDVLSGNYKPSNLAENIPPKPEKESVAETVEETVVVEEAAVEERIVEETEAVEEVVETVEKEVSEAVKERADAIADITTATDDTIKNEIIYPSVDEIETTPHKKGHGWIWAIVIIVLVLGIAAAVYLKWDAINGLITKIMN